MDLCLSNMNRMFFNSFIGFLPDFMNVLFRELIYWLSWKCRHQK